MRVAAIAASVALLAAVFAWLGLGATMGLPAIGGVFALTLAVVFERTRRSGFSILAAVVAAVAAFALDWFALFVLGAGHLELREVRKGPFYPALMVLLFVWPALTDSADRSR